LRQETVMKGTTTKMTQPKILILATISGGYAGADSVGQLHTDYASNVYILPTVCPAMFPESFYLDTFKKGIDAILVMYSGRIASLKMLPKEDWLPQNKCYFHRHDEGSKNDTKRQRGIG